jgi:hypothetical protein
MNAQYYGSFIGGGAATAMSLVNACIATNQLFINVLQSSGNKVAQAA